MSLLVADCPRCGSKNMTFDVRAQKFIGQKYDWMDYYEIFCVCRACDRPTIFLVHLRDIDRANRFSDSNYGLVHSDDALNVDFEIERFISLRDNAPTKPPEHLPPDIESAFKEGSACLSIGCNNATATMFRLCVDLVTRPLLPDAGDNAVPQPNSKQRRDLGLRLPWLFENGKLPPDLRELANCIKEDGNDGAHVGNLTARDAEDLLDFTVVLLERLITEPKKLKLAQERRIERRTPQNKKM